MAKVKKEIKKEERIYTIPLRKEWLKAPKYKRAKKAMKAIKEFVAKHMKVRDRDLKKVKIDRWINEAVWLRGIKKPPQKITVKAIKDSEGNIKVEFQALPPKFKKEEERLNKKIEKIRKKEEEKKKRKKKKEEKKPEKKTEEEKKKEEEKKEKEKALHKEIAKAKPEIRHEKPKQPKPIIHRKALEK